MKFSFTRIRFLLTRGPENTAVTFLATNNTTVNNILCRTSVHQRTMEAVKRAAAVTIALVNHSRADLR